MQRTGSSWLVVCLVLGGCMVKTSTSATGPVPDPEPQEGAVVPVAPGAVGVETVTDENGQTYQIQQGQPGDPAVVGCADGQREAFVDLAQNGRIAGCIASWDGAHSLRAPQTGAACGDDRGPCAVPADACAPGWRVCASNGAVADLLQIGSGERCEQAGGGRFSAGMSHCLSQEGCQYDPSPQGNYPCFESGWCSEPVCCGADCGDFGACTGGVWPELTHIAQGMDQGCAAQTSQRAGGVLCCKI
jgi:hypothetical protein